MFSVLSKSNITAKEAVGFIGGINNASISVQGLGIVDFLDSTPEAIIGIV